MAPGSFAANATEIYQEGLRLPPVKLFRRGRAGRGRVAHHARQPPHARDTRGATCTRMVGVAADRREARSRRSTTSTAWTSVIDGDPRALRLLRGVDPARDRGAARRHVLRARTPRRTTARASEPVVIARRRHGRRRPADRRLRAAPTRRPSARSTRPYVVTASGAYNGLPLPVRHRRPAQRRAAVRPIDVLAPAGTVVNVRHPGRLRRRPDRAPAARHGADVQGPSSAQLMPERVRRGLGRHVAATSSSAACTPRPASTTRTTTSRASAGAAAPTSDGNDAQIVPARQLPQHADRGASRRATRGSTSATRLNDDCGGAGAHSAAASASRG